MNFWQGLVRNLQGQWRHTWGVDLKVTVNEAGWVNVMVNGEIVARNFFPCGGDDVADLLASTLRALADESGGALNVTIRETGREAG